MAATNSNLRHAGSSLPENAGINYGNAMFNGNGQTRSCGKCGHHTAIKGGKMLRIRGWCCAKCIAPKDAP
jgi:hypothetical protein